MTTKAKTICLLYTAVAVAMISLSVAQVIKHERFSAQRRAWIVGKQQTEHEGKYFRAFYDTNGNPK